MAKHRRSSIAGAFAWRLIEMLESPAHRALSLSARKLLDRLEIELYRHGGKPEENGRLPCTFDHFVEFGVHRHAIGPGIREVVAPGFVEITRQGCAGNAGYRQPTWYRLTYRHAGSDKRITDDWRRIETIEEAEALGMAARAAKPEPRSKNKSPVSGNHHWHQCRKPHQSRAFPSVGNHHYRLSAGNCHYLYISEGYAAADRWMRRAR